MKKIGILLFSLISILTLASCKKEKEDINTPKEFNTGDIVAYNGVIYEYIDVFKDLFHLKDDEAREYIFEEEEEYKAYYNYYYLDMSDYKNQPKLRENHSILENSFGGEFDFNEENWPYLSPTTPYAFHLPSYLDISHRDWYFLKEAFIVKGYNEDLPENVEIPLKIHGKSVTQIGYRAFENAPMKSLKWSQAGYVHPYAISKCNNLKEIDFHNGILMSMAICNSPNIEKISAISPTSMDCLLYNLPNLKQVEIYDLFFSDSNLIFNRTAYSLGGLRKSFFYNCPKLESITGEYIEQAVNVVYYTPYHTTHIPIYVLHDNYVAIVPDYVFSQNDRASVNYTMMYNSETYEAYVPFLNTGLEKEKKGHILFEESESVTEDETGIYINATYIDSKYNAKLLFKRK